MADATITSPRRRRRWLRALVWLFGVLVVLVVAVYFVATSSAFFTGVILPRVSKAINANITVSEASISPFKEVILRNLKLLTTGQEPLVSATEVRARYSLMDIIGGHINIEEVALSSPTVVLNEDHGRRGECHFLNIDMAADDVHETVAGAHFRRADERLLARGQQFQVAQDDLLERADGCLADGDVGVDGFAHARENDAREKRGAGGYKINGHDQDDQNAEEPHQRPEPASAPPGRSNCCISHKNPVLSLIPLRGPRT